MNECVSLLRPPLGAGGSPSWWSQGLEGRRGVLSAGKRYFPGETPSPTLSGEGAFLFLGLGHLSPSSFHFFRLADSLWVSKPRSPPGFEAELTWEGGFCPLSRGTPAGRARRAGLGSRGLRASLGFF